MILGQLFVFSELLTADSLQNKSTTLCILFFDFCFPGQEPYLLDLFLFSVLDDSCLFLEKRKMITLKSMETGASAFGSWVLNIIEVLASSCRKAQTCMLLCNLVCQRSDFDNCTKRDND